MPHTTTLRLRRIRYWRLALGEDEAQWAAWRAGNFVAMGWDELGDLSILSRRDFEQRRAAILARFPERTKAGADLVWRFARHIGEGDRLVVCQGKHAVVGIATVSGPYFFVPDVDKGHCLPVMWDDLQERTFRFPNWRRPLVQLDLNQFEAVLQAPAVVAPAGKTPQILREASVPYLAAGAPGLAQPSEKGVVSSIPADAGVREASASLVMLADSLGYTEEEVARWVRAIERKGQLIFTGPPGVGKTYSARALARYLANPADGFWELVQFHAAYSYEDFIQGLRPHANAAGQLDYRIEAGHFLDFCRRAEERRGRCVLVIDEINRANVAHVFGELLFLLEYRHEAIRLAGGDQLFRIPANVRLIGTMNSADRSIALVDFALRRRFAFVDLAPNPSLLRSLPPQEKDFSMPALIKLVERVNKAIDDPAFAFGYAYFLRTDLADALPEIWQTEVEPYLAEYFYHQVDRIAEFRWQEVRPLFEATVTKEKGNGPETGSDTDAR